MYIELTLKTDSNEILPRVEITERLQSCELQNTEVFDLACSSDEILICPQ